mmetsp:Transcript_74212/g.117467  ORF Transcript_74212/g.117467 Transcript_74212/m.117467 type:complete len:85 (-) Transcript_74212:1222-1476(-)
MATRLDKVDKWASPIAAGRFHGIDVYKELSLLAPRAKARNKLDNTSPPALRMDLQTKPAVATEVFALCTSASSRLVERIEEEEY